MAFTLSQMLLVGAILFLGSLLQTLVGFGAGLLGIPLLMFAGFPPVQAVAIVTVSSIMQSAVGAYQLRGAIELRDTKRPVVIRLMMLPVGACLFWLLGQQSQQVVKQSIGLVLLVIVLVHWQLKVQPSASLHRGWEWFAFSASGFLLGFCGMGGPVLGLWAVAHDWHPQRSRGFMFVVMLGGNVPLALIHAGLFGTLAGWGLAWGCLGIPWVFLGTYVGILMGSRVSRQRLRSMMLWVLALVGIQAACWPILSRWLTG